MNLQHTYQIIRRQYYLQTFIRTISDNDMFGDEVLSNSNTDDNRIILNTIDNSKKIFTVDYTSDDNNDSNTIVVNNKNNHNNNNNKSSSITVHTYPRRRYC
jgi:hypothetical protein